MGQGLGWGGFGKGIVACPQTRDKDLSRDNFSRFTIEHGYGKAAVVYKEFVPTFLDLAHGQVLMA